MKNLVLLVAFTTLVTACSKVPITNRRQTHLLPETTLIEMSNDQYDAFLAEATVLPDSDPRAIKVKEVGEKIKDATVKYLTNKGYSKRIEGFQWEFKTVEEDVVNAWCMPGGKVCVYTGILPLFASDDEMAVVMGHEIAHAIARHGNERMSQQMIINGVGSVLSPADTTQVSIFQQVFIGSATLGMLKYSRNHETEADKLGLVFAKVAGYDPYAAITFWEKMAAQGSSVPEIFSTHPSDERRISDLDEFLKEIDQYIE